MLISHTKLLGVFAQAFFSFCKSHCNIHTWQLQPWPTILHQPSALLWPPWSSTTIFLPWPLPLWKHHPIHDDCFNVFQYKMPTHYHMWPFQSHHLSTFQQCVLKVLFFKYTNQIRKVAINSVYFSYLCCSTLLCPIDICVLIDFNHGYNHHGWDSRNQQSTIGWGGRNAKQKGV